MTLSYYGYLSPRRTRNGHCKYYPDRGPDYGLPVEMLVSLSSPSLVEATCLLCQPGDVVHVPGRRPESPGVDCSALQCVGSV